MLNEALLRQIIDTGELLELDEAVIEKDYYVTQVIHALSNLENETFRLVFCGGTCLAKAHKLVLRMSEDVDFKVQRKTSERFSRSGLKSELNKFRAYIRSTLTVPDLSVVNDFARNEGRYQQIILKYPNSFPIGSALRPDIKIELTFADILLPTDELEVKTIIENSLNGIKLFIPPITKCISIDETAIEKWVGLTRRIMAIERGYEDDDKTLIRHVYDLNAINKANKINSSFTEYAKTVILSDGKQFKNQHPEYAANPSAEITQSLALLKDKPLWKERYEEFIEAMVYDTANALPYNQAITTLEGISASVIKNL
ncbi:MAG TPA: nucleotidyl transferase AbiEii/AbiGii toxin family protein [Gammaproteobacteria bacterium]|nr:nucleotidyl transferase AbiEii/AbiGii toxin family protein [Gammaproteobacteria bacterium]